MHWGLLCRKCPLSYQSLYMDCRQCVTFWLRYSVSDNMQILVQQHKLVQNNLFFPLVLCSTSQRCVMLSITLLYVFAFWVCGRNFNSTTSHVLKGWQSLCNQISPAHVYIVYLSFIYGTSLYCVLSTLNIFYSTVIL